MKQIIFLIILSIISCKLIAQVAHNRKQLEASAGFGMLIYQSAYNMQDAFGIEAAVRGDISGTLDWQAGLRLGLGPVLPEVFGRLLIREEMGAWRPEIGLEFGITGRAEFEDGVMLLREARQAMQTDINAFYMAVHTAPLAFRVKEKWKLSTLEIDFGTHFTNMGRTLRAQITIISLGRRF